MTGFLQYWSVNKWLRVCLLVFGFALCTGHLKAQYAVNGSASQLSCNCYMLTPDANGQSGSVWNLNQINLYISFDYIFDTYFGTNDGGADGIGFVLQPISTTVGSSGGGMGFAGISPSWAVEMDTYQNGGEPSYDHMAIIKNGDVNHASPNNLAGPVQISANSANVEDGNWHQIRLIWDASSYTMLVYFDGILRLNQVYDIVGNVFNGNPNVYWGFTAATGGARNEHRFCVGLNPGIIASTITACQDQDIQFTDNSFSTLGTVQSWNWNFGDGTTSNLQNPVHAYNSPGTKTVTLIINDINGCAASTTSTVTVIAPPVVNAGADVAICDGSTTTLNGSGAGSYTWSPATGLSSASAASPVASPVSTTTYSLTVVDANGCQGTDDVVVTVNPLPVAEFSSTDECFGTPIQFTDLSSIPSGSITGYSWSFGDTQTSSNANPSNSYAADGLYTVDLTVTGTGGCTSTVSHAAVVHPTPVADFSFTDECFSTPNTFTDLSSVGSGSTIAQWGWDFDGDGTSTLASPTHTFTSHGLKNVSLGVVSSDGCVASVSKVVNVFPNPVAAFTAPDVCFGNTTDFTDQSSINGGTISSWDWNFDDTYTSSIANPSHDYSAANQYNVVLTVTSSDNCISSVTQPVAVTVNPTASFTFVEACETDNATFTSTSTIPQGSISSWLWNFGDSQLASGATQSHPYSLAGTYTVSLIASTAAGCADTIEQDIEIHPYPTIAFTATTECYGTPTTFTDGSSVTGDVISSWQWSFGSSGATSVSANPTYNYAAAGVYDVTLVVSTSNSCSATATSTVEVYATPVAAFDNTPVCLHNPSQFTNTSSIDLGNIVSNDWDFGVAGATSTDENPNYLYTADGTYTVELTTTSDNGCVDVVTHSVVVHPLPEVAFTSDVTEGCMPLDVQFSDNSSIASGYISAYDWSLGDGPGSSLTNPFYQYTLDGSYDVGLLLTSDKGCTSFRTIADAVTVYPLPIAGFKFGPQPTNMYDPVIDFADASVGASQWDWDFGDFNNSVEQNPVHEYQDSGTYVVQLVSTTDFGCSDTIEDVVVIDPVFTLFVPNSFTPGKDGINDKFFARGVGIIRFNMRIFNRWGEQVFSGYNIDEGWNGYHQNSGEEMEPGVYVYHIKLQEISGLEHVYKGKIQLIR